MEQNEQEQREEKEEVFNFFLFSPLLSHFIFHSQTKKYLFNKCLPKEIM